MELYLVRHAESAGNTGLSDGPDPELTDLGIRQARAAAERLADLGLEVLFCSPLRRALQTAEILGEGLNLRYHVYIPLYEKGNYEGFRGLSRAEILAQFPRAVLPADFPEFQWWPNGPEEEPQAYERAGLIEQEMRRRYQESEARVLMVTHGTFGAIMISRFLKAPPEGFTKFSQHNCGISLLEIHPGTAKLRFLNDVAHLPGELGGGNRYAPRPLP